MEIFSRKIGSAHGVGILAFYLIQIWTIFAKSNFYILRNFCLYTKKINYISQFLPIVYLANYRSNALDQMPFGRNVLIFPSLEMITNDSKLHIAAS